LISEDFDHSRVTALRHSIASCARAAGLDGDRLADFVVAVNELLTNAVRHGGGSGHVLLWLDNGSLICEVTDRGNGIPAPIADPSRPASDEPGGWGLWLVGELSDTFAVTSGNDGTSVRISCRLPQ
jgi:serine/threonine-protein kinase RsbW